MIYCETLDSAYELRIFLNQNKITKERIVQIVAVPDYQSTMGTFRNKYTVFYER